MQTKHTDNGRQPLASIVIYNYDPKLLENCLNSIFGQRHLTDFEVILCDDCNAGDAWQLANQYMTLHPDRITLTRNQTPWGPGDNANKGLQMARGKYFVKLTNDREFDPEYISVVISRIESDPLLVHSYIGKLKELHGNTSPERKRKKNPLVSICIYNYNYGRYLRQCLDSVAEQTYDNIEICFSDNASTDDSWQVALDFSSQYTKRMSLTRNRMNFGASSNLINCLINYQGKYVLTLCSDDAIRPNFVERCVTLLEQHADAAFAMVHREIIDEEGNLRSEPPFYDQTCLIPGHEQAAVYMLAAVNPSVSQILYNHERIQVKDHFGGLNARWFAARILDFTLCLEYPIIYIRDPLLLNRVHSLSDGATIDANLMQCVGQYVLLHQFSEHASAHGLDKAAGRLGEAIEKVGRLCLRYCGRFLLNGEEVTALRYLHLGQAIFPAIANDPIFLQLQAYWQSPDTTGRPRQEILRSLVSQSELTVRQVSYSPPPGSTIC